MVCVQQPLVGLPLNNLRWLQHKKKLRTEHPCLLFSKLRQNVSGLWVRLRHSAACLHSRLVCQVSCSLRHNNVLHSCHNLGCLRIKYSLR